MGLPCIILQGFCELRSPKQQQPWAVLPPFSSSCRLAYVLLSGKAAFPKWFLTLVGAYIPESFEPLLYHNPCPFLSPSPSPVVNTRMHSPIQQILTVPGSVLGTGNAVVTKRGPFLTEDCFLLGYQSMHQEEIFTERESCVREYGLWVEVANIGW